jgi:hypothetical protein
VPVKELSRTRVFLGGAFLLFSLNLTPNVADATPLQLDPVSLSFPTPQLGYVLSLYDCATNTCAGLRSTNDAASSWSVVPIPSELDKNLQLVSWDTYGSGYATLNVHFADAQNGWIYGTVPAPVTPDTSSPNWQYRLWSTHNAGKSWQQIRLDPLSLSGGVVQMATHGAWTYLFGGSNDSGSAYILATHSSADQWVSKSNAQLEMPAGGTQLEGAFTFAGSNGWFVAGNDRGFTASARLSKDGSWSEWSRPSIETFGASFTPIVAVTNKVLLVECQSAGFVYPPASSVPRNWNRGASWLFISYDGGETFKPLRQLSSSYQGSYSTVPGLPAAPVPGTVLLQQATKSGYQLVRSTNWGQSWHVVLNHSVSQVVFTSHATGFAIEQRSSNQLDTWLIKTSDAGNNWGAVSF